MVETVSSSDEGEPNWGLFTETMVACLIFHQNVDDLVDYWKANANMLDYAKKVAPENWMKIRNAFASHKAEIMKG